MDGKNAAGIIVLVLLSIILKIAVVGATLWFNAARPVFTQNVFETYAERGKRCFWLGLANAVVIWALAAILISTQVLAIVGMVLFVLLVCAVIVGYGAGYQHVGRRLLNSGDDRRTQATAVGALVAEGAFWLPVAGQLLAFYMCFRGLGAVVTVLWNKKPVEQVQGANDAQPVDERPAPEALDA